MKRCKVEDICNQGTYPMVDLFFSYLYHLVAFPHGNTFDTRSIKMSEYHPGGAAISKASNLAVAEEGRISR